MSIAVHVQLIEVFELVEWVVLKVVGLDLFILSWLGLVLKTGLVRDSRRLVVTWLHSGGQETSIESRSP